MNTYDLCIAILQSAENNTYECRLYSRNRWPLHCANRYYRALEQAQKALDIAEGRHPTRHEIGYYLGRSESATYEYSILSESEIRLLSRLADDIRKKLQY